MAHSDKYDTPKKPKATPPAIEPANQPKSSDEMAAEGEREGDVLKAAGKDGVSDTSLSRELAEKQRRREGAGERELDAMKPETLTPPD